jgi:hypothetical protein
VRRATIEEQAERSHDLLVSLGKQQGVGGGSGYTVPGVESGKLGLAVWRVSCAVKYHHD